MAESVERSFLLGYHGMPTDFLVNKPVEMVAWLMAGALLVFFLYVWEQRRSNRDNAPSYQAIPATVLSHIASRQDLQDMDGKIDIAIVGSGVGALVSGAVLSKCGYQVAVFEQHSTVGGSTHVFKSNGFEFDVGVHYIGGSLDSCWSIFRILFDEVTDGQLKWNRIAENYDVAFNNTTGERLEFTGDPQQNRKTLLTHFPSCEKALDSYLTKCRRARLVAYVAFGMKCLPPVVTRIVWNLGYGSLYRRVCLGKTLDVMRDCGLPDRVIGAITYNYGDYGTCPADSPFFVQAFMQSHYNGGAFFPKGGSTSIARTLVAAILRQGGRVFAASSVDHILTRKTWRGHRAVGVRVRGSDIFVRKCVISNTGFTKTFEIDRNGNPPLVDQVASTSQLALVHKKETKLPFQLSNAFFYLFVGFDGSDEELHLPGQNIWHLQDWNHDALKKKLFESEGVVEALKEQPPLVFLSNESAKDPDYSKRNPGKATATLIAWTNAKWFENWREKAHSHRGQEYERIKSDMTTQLLNILYQHFPRTKGRVIFAELGTPLSANKFLGRTCGEIYNLDHNVERFGSLEAHLALHPETTVRGLYLTGQDVVGVSIEGAALSGLFASVRISFLAFIFVGMAGIIACLPWATGLLV